MVRVTTGRPGTQRIYVADLGWRRVLASIRLRPARRASLRLVDALLQTHGWASRTRDWVYTYDEVNGHLFAKRAAIAIKCGNPDSGSRAARHRTAPPGATSTLDRATKHAVPVRTAAPSVAPVALDDTSPRSLPTSIDRHLPLSPTATAAHSCKPVTPVAPCYARGGASCPQPSLVARRYAGPACAASDLTSP